MATTFAGATAWCQAAHVPAGCPVRLAIGGNSACPPAVTGMAVVTLDGLPAKPSRGVPASPHTRSGGGLPGKCFPRRAAVAELDAYCSAVSMSRASVCGRRGCLHGSGSDSLLLGKALHAGGARWCLPHCVTVAEYHGLACSRACGRDGAGSALGRGEGHD